jgi:hypothetical protein
VSRQHQQPKAPQAEGKFVRQPAQHQRTGLSVQTPSSTNNDTLEIANLVQQIMTQLSEAVSEKYKIIIITKIVLNLMKQNGY